MHEHRTCVSTHMRVSDGESSLLDIHKWGRERMNRSEEQQKEREKLNYHSNSNLCWSNFSALKVSGGGGGCGRRSKGRVIFYGFFWDNFYFRTLFDSRISENLSVFWKLDCFRKIPRFKLMKLAQSYLKNIKIRLQELTNPCTSPESI